MSDIADRLQKLIERSPFPNWLGLQVLRLDGDGLDLRATWRPEWVADPELGQTQGGVLAALVDFAADFALFAKLERPLPTIDMRIDYHRFARKGDLFISGRVIKCGGQIASCEAYVRDTDGILLASGRGTYLVAQK